MRGLQRVMSSRAECDPCASCRSRAAGVGATEVNLVEEDGFDRRAFAGVLSKRRFDYLPDMLSFTCL